MDPIEIYEDLKEKIIWLDIEPGSTLNLVDLAASYGVSRNPVMIALTRLNVEEWVIRQGVHFVVSPLTVDRMREITEIRSLMETQANIWAMNRISPEGMAELTKIRDEINALHTDATKKEIACRVIFVFSTADQKVVRKQRQKQIDQIREGLGKTQKNVARRGPHSDEASVARRLSRLFGSKDTAKYFSWKMVKLTKPQQKKLRSPDRGSRPPTHRFEFTFDQKAVREDEEYDGYSALVTTVPQKQLSANALFTKFKQQIYSEQINRGFKGPLAVRPVFLHTPQRVEALVFLMMAVLMLYYMLQRIYRQTVPEDATQKEQRTTTNTIFKAFSSYALLIHRTRLGLEVQPTRPTTRQREMLQQLGLLTPAQILSKRLPRPPT